MDLNAEWSPAVRPTGSVQLAMRAKLFGKLIRFSPTFDAGFRRAHSMEALLEPPIARRPVRGFRRPISESIMDSFGFMPSHVLPLHPWVPENSGKARLFILDEWTDYGGASDRSAPLISLKILNAFSARRWRRCRGGGNICLVAEARPASGAKEPLRANAA